MAITLRFLSLADHLDLILAARELCEEVYPTAPRHPGLATLAEQFTGGDRIDTLVHDLVEHSAEAGDIVQGDEAGAAMTHLREFMFERVYLSPQAREEHSRVSMVIGTLFDHYRNDPNQIPLGASPAGATEAERVTDWIAGMTDRFSIRAFEDLAVPTGFER